MICLSLLKLRLLLHIPEFPRDTLMFPLSFLLFSLDSFFVLHFLLCLTVCRKVQYLENVDWNLK